MIHPQMATMLCFITTDARDRPRDAAARAGCRPSTRRSTPSPSTATCRPTTRVIALANGASGAPPIEPGSAAYKTAGGDADQPVRRSGQGDRRRRGRGQQAVHRRRGGRARAGDGARSGPRGGGRQPGEIGDLRRRSVLGADPRRAGRPHRRARISRSIRPASRWTSRGFASTATVGRWRSTRTICRPACGRPRSPRGWTCGLGKASARALGCDLDVRLREDQRRVLLGAEEQPRCPERQAPARRGEPPGDRRGAQLHPQVRRQAGGHQVRRRGDDRSGAQAQFRRGDGAVAVGGVAAGDRARRRPRDHQDAGEDGAQVGVRRRPADHRRRGGPRGRDGADRVGSTPRSSASSTAWAATPLACRARTAGCSSPPSWRRRPARPISASSARSTPSTPTCSTCSSSAATCRSSRRSASASTAPATTSTPTWRRARSPRPAAPSG